MSSANTAQELNFLAEEYITNFGIKTHKDLKRVGEFRALPEDSQRKLYDKVRYRTQRGNLRLVTDPLVVETKKRPDPIGSQKLKFKDKTKSASTILLLAFIFFFLASESLKFYDQFEILPIFKYSIPFVIEFSVLILSLKKSKIARVLLIGLVVFNTATFTYKTIECDKNIKKERETKASKSNFLKDQKEKLERQSLAITSELSHLKKQHDELISKNYFRLANETYQESIKSKEIQLQKIQEKEEKTSNEFLKTGLVREGNSFLSLDTFFMITLKCILQAVFVFLILEIKGFQNA